jgi:NAD(P)-dependent dehydrogenase (short-subunit alcohol dehydrogenase family)
VQLTFPEGGALVAGGTGNVGAGVARVLAQAGLPVVFTYRSREDEARRFERTLLDAGHRVKAVRMDMADIASIDAALDVAEAFGGPLRTLTCATGATVPFDRLVDFSIDEVEAFFAGDVLAYYRLLHQAVPRLRAGGGGSVTVTTTIATSRVIDWDGISSFSKGAVEALIRQLAAEEARHGIRCNAVGISVIVEIPLADALAGASLAPPPVGERLGELLGQLNDRARLGRGGTPDEAGYLFAFLASDQAAFITGQRINIDGGMAL